MWGREQTTETVVNWTTQKEWSQGKWQVVYKNTKVGGEIVNLARELWQVTYEIKQRIGLVQREMSEFDQDQHLALKETQN